MEHSGIMLKLTLTDCFFYEYGSILICFDKFNYATIFKDLNLLQVPSLSDLMYFFYFLHQEALLKLVLIQQTSKRRNTESFQCLVVIIHNKHPLKINKRIKLYKI